MRFAPLRGTCVICQAPEPTRVAINAAIWPGEAMIRSATYRADAVDVARSSGIPAYARLNPKTVTRHVDHVESSWREVAPNDQPRGDEVVVKGDFLSLGERLGGLAGHAADVLEPQLRAGLLEPKEVIAIAKMGMTAATAVETSRLKRNQQAIDVMAIFAASSGHAPPAIHDDVDDVPPDVLKAALSAERRQLAERNE